MKMNQISKLEQCHIYIVGLLKSFGAVLNVGKDCLNYNDIQQPMNKLFFKEGMEICSILRLSTRLIKFIGKIIEQVQLAKQKGPTPRDKVTNSVATFCFANSTSMLLVRLDCPLSVFSICTGSKRKSGYNVSHLDSGD